MKTTLTAETLLQLDRLGAVSLAPDGQEAVCTVSQVDLKHNRMRSALWLLPLHGGEPPRALTTCGQRDGAPAHAPDGHQVAFTAEREQEGSKDTAPQLYLIPRRGGEARRVSHYQPGIGAFRWMPDARQIVFIAWVWPDLKGEAAQNRRQEAWNQRRASGVVTQETQYRYWNAHLPQGRVAHLHLLDIRTGKVTDLFENSAYELPRDEPGLNCFDVSPDGKTVVFTHDPHAVKAGGQRCELVQLTIKGRRFKRIAHHERWDFQAPRYSPAGHDIACIATPVHRTDTPYGHASYGRLAVWPTSRAFRPSDARAWQHDPLPPLQWEQDGRALWFTAEAAGRCHGWRYERASGSFTRQVHGGWVQGLAVQGSGESATVLTVRDSAQHPARAYARQAGSEQRVERFNDELLRTVRLGLMEERTVKGALGEEVQLWVTYPPGHRSGSRRSALHVIHGGPYSASGDTFSYRWNPHVFAALGHVVVQTNYHGSSGFGESFRTSILGRQGQLELLDLKAANNWIRRQPWCDPSRVYAAGASYGGFLVAWMNGHWRPWPKGPIRAYICHAGVLDRRATWSADSYTQRHKDLAGTYWEQPERLAAQSPVEHAARMDTPTFVIHGAQDFRVPDHNGLAYYNTLKARGVDARLLWFPDEGHWVLKPHNALQWYAEFESWLVRHGARRSGMA
ncbi:MAG: S9 family peptidase [Betaproteobacteria bacterium]|nr:S9 family peptidase [Betaproteobacteria bacterium]NBT09905.1 S9 family peptidase [Betaproteobacteria bacterium]NBU49037.1 S9 family peptidase [Betaproteobacteria bacterium]